MFLYPLATVNDFHVLLVVYKSYETAGAMIKCSFLPQSKFFAIHYFLVRIAWSPITRFSLILTQNSIHIVYLYMRNTNLSSQYFTSIQMVRRVWSIIIVMVLVAVHV